jgi:hypothetical protein
MILYYIYILILLLYYINSLIKGPSAKVFPGQLNGDALSCGAAMRVSWGQPTRPKMVESALNQIPQTWLINLTSNWICPKWGSPKFRSLPVLPIVIFCIEMMRLFGIQYMHVYTLFVKTASWYSCESVSLKNWWHRDPHLSPCQTWALENKVAESPRRTWENPRKTKQLGPKTIFACAINYINLYSMYPGQLYIQINPVFAINNHKLYPIISHLPGSIVGLQTTR